MTHDEIRRLLEVIYPEHRERAPGAAELVYRLLTDPVGDLMREAVRAHAPTERPPADADLSPLPDTLPTGRPRP